MIRERLHVDVKKINQQEIGVQAAVVRQPDKHVQGRVCSDVTCCSLTASKKCLDAKFLSLPATDRRIRKLIWVLRSGCRPLQQASPHQMADISMMNAAGLFIRARGSPSQRNYHPATVYSSHKSKGKIAAESQRRTPVSVFSPIVQLVRGRGAKQNVCLSVSTSPDPHIRAA